jgi:hypothetical protein
VVELKLTEAVVRDPEPCEDAAAIAGPHVGPHTWRDRIWQAGITATMPGRVATEHQPPTPSEPGVRPPRMSRRA